MKLVADWMQHAGTLALFDAIEGGGFHAHYVGGCVRNGLLGTSVDDVDITTNALPEQVMSLSERAGLKPIPTGIEHGTITVVADGKPLEVTTLRRDMTTDGRRATVAFSDSLEEDAQRRDFTMNALYATRDGAVLDPTGQGLDDLNTRRLRFIGQPEDRIREDYLRILRFFRFHAWFADLNRGLDAEGLAACAALADGLHQLSRERVGSELRKLLAAPDPSPAVAAMAQSGILLHVLPGADARALPILTGLENRATPDPMRRLAALGGEDPSEALRLSKADAKRFHLMRDGMANTMAPAELGYRLGAQIAQDILLLRAAQFETPVDPSAISAVTQGAAARFPVKAVDLMPRFAGPALGAKLAALEAAWIASGFALTRNQLLSLAD